MKFTVLTLFPEMFTGFLNASIIKRAIEKETIEVEVVDIREFSTNKHRHVDDTPYGGGAGMLMQIEPLDLCLDSVIKDNSYTLLTSPKAKPYSQKDAKRLSEKEHIVVICGHYEGVDERIESRIDEHFSLGDYILTGGELASMVLIDSITRLISGSIKQESLEEESYNNHLLEYPQYTKPENYKGMKVPEVLLSGNHQEIKHWRDKMSLYETLKYRPDLLKDHKFSKAEIELLKELEKELKN